MQWSFYEVQNYYAFCFGNGIADRNPYGLYPFELCWFYSGENHRILPCRELLARTEFAMRELVMQLWTVGIGLSIRLGRMAPSALIDVLFRSAFVNRNELEAETIRLSGWCFRNSPVPGNSIQGRP
jgi:hypothetical protein